MRKILLALFVGCGALIASCDHFHTSENDVLDGFWQLTDVDTLATGHSGDVKHLMIFWAVNANLLEIRDMSDMPDAHIHVFFRFKRQGNQLTLSDPVADDRFISDSIITDVNTIRYYGLSHLTETLKILRLDSKKMTLESERLRMYFRKY